MRLIKRLTSAIPVGVVIAISIAILSINTGGIKIR